MAFGTVFGISDRCGRIGRRPGEFLVPVSVDRLIREGKCSVRVLDVNEKWFGMTYAQDLEAVKAEILRLTEKGIYSDPLWVKHPL